MVAELAVHLYGRHVADLLDAGQGMCGLRYTDEGVQLGPAARVSLALPPRAEIYAAFDGAQKWAEALLPEGRALDAVATEWRLSAQDTFSLLAEVGRDVAGALVILRPGEDPTDLLGARYEPLSEQALAQLVDNVHEHPLGLDRKNGVRLSLAGVQDKLLLHRAPRSRAYMRPINGAPSTLILKPEPRSADQAADTTGLVTNELYGLLLASLCKIPTADASAISINGRPCLLVERYDRDRTVSPPSRLHQEDLLMALGKDRRFKYEEPDTVQTQGAGGFAESQLIRTGRGPTLRELAGVLTATMGDASLVRFLQAVVFNVAFGNADAHARNYSLLLHPTGLVTIAPLYDLVCTRMFEGLTSTAAQAVNGINDIDEIGIKDLAAEGERWGLPADLAQRTVATTISRMQGALEQAERKAVRAGGDSAIATHMSQLVARRLQALR